MLNIYVMHHHTGPATGILVWGGIGYHSRTLLVHINGTLNSQRYIFEVLEPVGLPYLQGLTTAIFQKDNARPHVARIVQSFFYQSIDLIASLVGSLSGSFADRKQGVHGCLAIDPDYNPPATTPVQLWQRLGAAWYAVPQERIQSLFESIPRRVVAVIPTNGGYSGY
ncbi:transposable element Tcb1 transposase [Trichonephila clavipes]|nr:transposable element Tcb1 transposase [Trichonephila clavipes]